jgi:aromatic ring hydroxylase
MGIRTGKELLESLRDDRALFIDGERVADVTRALPERRGASPNSTTCSTTPHSSSG